MIKSIKKIGFTLSKEEQKNISGGYDCIFLGTCDTEVLCQCIRDPDIPIIRVSSCFVCEQICGKGFYFCEGVHF